MKVPFLQRSERRPTGFYFPRPGNLLLVHGTGEGEVSVYATTDNLSREQQAAFIRYLCAEGFLRIDCELPGCFDQNVRDQEQPPVRWIVDPSWREADAAFALHIRRLCWCTAGTLMVWLAFMAALVCC